MWITNNPIQSLYLKVVCLRWWWWISDTLQSYNRRKITSSAIFTRESVPAWHYLGRVTFSMHLNTAHQPIIFDIRLERLRRHTRMTAWRTQTQHAEVDGNQIPSSQRIVPIVQEVTFHISIHTHHQDHNRSSRYAQSLAIKSYTVQHHTLTFIFIPANA